MLSSASWPCNGCKLAEGACWDAALLAAAAAAKACAFAAPATAAATSDAEATSAAAAASPDTPSSGCAAAGVASAASRSGPDAGCCCCGPCCAATGAADLTAPDPASAGTAETFSESCTAAACTVLLVLLELAATANELAAAWGSSDAMAIAAVGAATAGAASTDRGSCWPRCALACTAAFKISTLSGGRDACASKLFCKAAMR